jgi:hypothetical protein
MPNQFNMSPEPISRVETQFNISPERVPRMLGQQSAAGPREDVDYSGYDSVNSYAFNLMDQYGHGDSVDSNKVRRAGSKIKKQGASLTYKRMKQEEGRILQKKADMVEMIKQSKDMYPKTMSANQKISALYKTHDADGTVIKGGNIPALFMINAAPDPMTIISAMQFYRQHGNLTIFGFCAPYTGFQPENANEDGIMPRRDLYGGPANIRAQHSKANVFNHTIVDSQDTFKEAQTTISTCVETLMEFIRQHEIITIFSSPARPARCVHIEKQNEFDEALEAEDKHYLSAEDRNAANKARLRLKGANVYGGPIKCYFGDNTETLKGPNEYSFQGRTPNAHQSSNPDISEQFLEGLLRPSYFKGLFKNVPIVDNVDKALMLRTDYGATFLADVTAFATILACLLEIQHKRTGQGLNDDDLVGRTMSEGIPDMYELKTISNVSINEQCGFGRPIHGEKATGDFEMCEVAFGDVALDADGLRVDADTEGYVIALDPSLDTKKGEAISLQLSAILTSIEMREKLPAILTTITMIADPECNDVDDRSAILLAELLMEKCDGSVNAFPVCKRIKDKNVKLWKPITCELHKYWESMPRK